MAPGAVWPYLEVHAEAATDKHATITLLQEAIRAAVPEAAEGYVVKRIVLECLVSGGITHKGLGHFRADAVHIGKLGSMVRTACKQAGPEALSILEQYGKLTVILKELQDLVTRQEVSPGTTVALLRADVLSARMALHPASSSTSSDEDGPLPARRTAATSSSGSSTTGGDYMPPKAAEAVIPLGPLLFEFQQHALPFRMTSFSPGSVRFAITRIISQLPGVPATPVGSVLLQTALAAVLRASELERPASVFPTLMRLSCCSVAQAQHVMRSMLQQAKASEAVGADYKALYGGSLGRMLAEQPDCVRLVQLSGAVGPAQRALLRVDLLLGPACILRGGMPPHALGNPAANKAGQSLQQGAQPQPQQPTPPPQEAARAALTLQGAASREHAQKGQGARAPLVAQAQQGMPRPLAPPPPQGIPSSRQALLQRVQHEDPDLPPGFGGTTPNTGPAQSVPRQTPPQHGPSMAARSGPVTLLRRPQGEHAPLPPPPQQQQGAAAQQAAQPQQGLAAPQMPFQQQQQAVAVAAQHATQTHQGVAPPQGPLQEQQQQQNGLQLQLAASVPQGDLSPQLQQQPGKEGRELRVALPQQPDSVRVAAPSSGDLVWTLVEVQRVRGAVAAGIDARLVGGFLAVYCAKPAEERGVQGSVLVSLLSGARWEEACAFMVATMQLAGLDPWVGNLQAE